MSHDCATAVAGLSPRGKPHTDEGTRAFVFDSRTLPGASCRSGSPSTQARLNPQRLTGVGVLPWRSRRAPARAAGRGRFAHSLRLGGAWDRGGGGEETGDGRPREGPLKRPTVRLLMWISSPARACAGRLPALHLDAALSGHEAELAPGGLASASMALGPRIRRRRLPPSRSPRRSRSSGATCDGRAPGCGGSSRHSRTAHFGHCGSDGEREG